MAGTEVSKKRKAAPATTTPPKKAKRTSDANIPASTKTSAAKKAAQPAAPAPAPVDDEKPFSDEEEDVESDVEDDQTAALLKGFGDSDDEQEDGADGAEITEIPSFPQSADLQTKLSAAAKTDSSEPGVVYLGRIPHGFYEHQMRSYFSQFGDIARLRLSRNKKTGQSKHYAFIEFAHEEVAKVVADTMNNYLMFGHILKAHLVEKDHVHENLFKGAGKRFKKVPWNKIERFQLQAADREGWKKRVANEESRRNKKSAKLKELGYEYTAPQLRSVDDVPVQSATAGDKSAIEDVKEEAPKAIKADAVDEEAAEPVVDASAAEAVASPEPVAAAVGGKKKNLKAVKSDGRVVSGSKGGRKVSKSRKV